MEVVDGWLTKLYPRTPTWREIADVVEHIGHSSLADSIRQAYVTGVKKFSAHLSALIELPDNLYMLESYHFSVKNPRTVQNVFYRFSTNRSIASVFTRERFTFALVRTLTLGVRMQAIQPIYCAISFSDWAAVTHEARRACREPSAEY